MKYYFTIPSIVILVLPFVVITSCIFPDYSNEKNWAGFYGKWKPGPKEMRYFEQLKLRGFSEINSYINSNSEYGEGPPYIYKLEMNSTIHVTKNNIDSMTLVRQRIANELYCMLEDSIIYDFDGINIFINANEDDNLYVLNSNYWDQLSKDSLEKWNGFKVVKKGENKYKRVML